MHEESLSDDALHVAPAIPGALPPPRFSALRLRAFSTSTWRIARAAIRLKCVGDVAASCGELANFSHASFTSAVGVKVLQASFRLTADANRRNSS